MNAPPQTWFGQPRGLTILFLTEMWEIFSYYGMRALLVYYMTKQLLIGQEKASLIYGVYTAMAYFTPIFGGIIADRWLGKRRAVIIGGSIMAAGHFMMAFEPLFYLALATIALGNGLFFPSLPSQIDGLYRPDDPRRGWAYNVYYVGINVGGFLAPLICGTLGELYGWHWGFGAAGVGMLAGLLIYVLGGKYLPEQARVEKSTPAARCAATPAASYRTTFILLFAVIISVTVFRGAYEQVGNTVALWADVGIDRATAAHDHSDDLVPSLESAAGHRNDAHAVGALASACRAGSTGSSMRKMALGALFVAAAYLLLARGGVRGRRGPRELAVAGGFLRHLYLGRTVYFADGPRAVCAPGARGLRRHHGGCLVLRDIHRQSCPRASSARSGRAAATRNFLPS